MKTEIEYRELFLKTIANTDPEISEIANHYWNDLTTHLSSYFSHESREVITVKAAQMLQANLGQENSIHSSWQSVIRDFLNSNYWNQPLQNQKPLKIKTEEQKNSWKLFKYVWALVQASIILKIAVYYFGLGGAMNPEETNPAWVWVFFGLSVLSLASFAYFNRHDDN